MGHTLQLFSFLFALPTSLCQLIQIIAGGQDGLTFSPSNLEAPVGSEVQFQFHHGGFSIASSNYENPCEPDGRLFSGHAPVSSGVGPGAFTIHINDSEPIWFYSTEEAHCQVGMVGVINPPASGPQTLDEYMRAAMKTPVGSSGGLPDVTGGARQPLAADGAVAGSSGSNDASSESGAEVARGGEDPHKDLKRRRRARRNVESEEDKRDKLLWEASLLAEE